MKFPRIAALLHHILTERAHFRHKGYGAQAKSNKPKDFQP